MDRQTDDNSFGKGEADSSILSGSTIQNPNKSARLRSRTTIALLDDRHRFGHYFGHSCPHRQEWRMATITETELRSRMGEITAAYADDRSVNRTVDGIRTVSSPAERVALLAAVYDGMLDVERDEREATFSKMRTGVPADEHWGTGSVSPWGRHASGPLVGCSLGAPPARFERVGRPALDYAAMRFIVAARENFDFLLDLAKEALELRQTEGSVCEGQLCYYRGCQRLAGCVQGYAPPSPVADPEQTDGQ